MDVLLSKVKDQAVRNKLCWLLGKKLVRQQHGSKTVSVDDVLHNPFVLLGMHGWTFAMVDHVADCMCVPLMTRAKELVRAAFKKHMSERGATQVWHAVILREILAYGAGLKPCLQIPADARRKAFETMRQEGVEIVPAGPNCWTTADCHMWESHIYDFACGSRQQPLLANETDAAAKLLATGECWQAAGQKPTQEQQRAVLSAFGSSRLSLVAGRPGCGKSACCGSIALIADKLGWNVHFAAFTWLAAHRITQMCGGSKEATSIHKVMYQNKASGLTDTLDLLVLDEASMVPSFLLYGLLRCLPPRCRLLLVGDPDQLPPIEQGQPFADLVHAARSGCNDCLAANFCELDQVFRSSEPHIVQANSACRGESIPSWLPVSRDVRVTPGPDLEWDTHTDPSTILDSLTNIIAANHKDQADWQIITAGKKGPVSMAVINALAAPLVRPAFDGVAYKYALGELVMLLGSGSIGTVTSRRKDGTIGVRWLSYAGELPACTNMARHEVAPLFVVGDRVMYTSSTSEDQRVRNGDRGVVLAIDTKAMVVTVQYEGVDVPIAHAMDDLHTRVQLAYAITVHKYQGNEAQHVIVVVHASHGTKLATQNLLYTAVTRGRKKVTAFCCPEVFKRCMMNKVQRNTYLRAVLIG